jgi:hypothetical protein
MRVPSSIVATLILCLSLSGCKKKSAPEFFKLQSQYASLVANYGDDAYTMEELNAVESGLKAIGDDKLESPRAQALLVELGAEKARVMAAVAALEASKRAARDTAAAWQPPSAFPSTPVAAVNSAPNDAGLPTLPWPQMSETDFKKIFGNCMKSLGKQAIGSLGEGTVYSVDTRSDCQKKYGTSADLEKRFLFFKEKLVGDQNVSTTRTVIDAGSTTTIIKGTPVPVGDAVPQVFGIPAITDPVGGGAP